MSKKLFTGEQMELIEQLAEMGVKFIYYAPCESGVSTEIIPKFELEDFWANKESYIEMKKDQEGLKGSSSGKTIFIEKSKPRSGFVYLVREKSEGQIKIGKAIDVNNRLKTFNVKLPFKIDLMYTFECVDYSEAEITLHEFFANKRTNGEWFALDDSDVTLIKNNKFLSSVGIEVIS